MNVHRLALTTANMIEGGKKREPIYHKNVLLFIYITKLAAFAAARLFNNQLTSKL